MKMPPPIHKLLSVNHAFDVHFIASFLMGRCPKPRRSAGNESLLRFLTALREARRRA